MSSSGENKQSRFEIVVITAVVLLLAPAVFDIPVLHDVAVTFEYTIGAIAALIGVFVVTRLVDAANVKRERRLAEERFSGLSMIAFRSLSQCLNDAGRLILSPIVGIRLRDWGIPGQRDEDFDIALEQLERVGLGPLEWPSSGFWNQYSEDRLLSRLELLSDMQPFATVMMRSAAGARREIQDSLAEWSAVMVGVPGANERLQPVWALTDKLVEVMESWRAVVVSLADGANEELLAELALRARKLTLEGIRDYRHRLEDMQQDAKLPTRGDFFPSDS